MYIQTGYLLQHNTFAQHVCFNTFVSKLLFKHTHTHTHTKQLQWELQRAEASEDICHIIIHTYVTSSHIHVTSSYIHNSSSGNCSGQRPQRIGQEPPASKTNSSPSTPPHSRHPSSKPLDTPTPPHTHSHLPPLFPTPLHLIPPRSHTHIHTHAHTLSHTSLPRQQGRPMSQGPRSNARTPSPHLRRATSTGALLPRGEA